MNASKLVENKPSHGIHFNAFKNALLSFYKLTEKSNLQLFDVFSVASLLVTKWNSISGKLWKTILSLAPSRREYLSLIHRSFHQVGYFLFDFVVSGGVLLECELCAPALVRLCPALEFCPNWVFSFHCLFHL